MAKDMDQASDEMRAEVLARFERYASRLGASQDWTERAVQADLRRMVALCWPFIDRYSRSNFVASLDRDWLFQPIPDMDPATVEDVELTSILHRWPECLTGLEGQELKFAQEIDKLRRFKRWKPSEKQVSWIKTIWAGHVRTIGMNPAVME